MLSYQKDLLTLCSRALFGGEAGECVPITEELISEARKQTVFSLICRFIGENSAHKNRALGIAARNIVIKNEHILVDKLMYSAGIPYVILKGCASAAYYSEPILRTMGDVDFLVRPEDVPHACAALEAAGFKTEDDETSLHYCYTKGDSVIELHFAINGIPNNDLGEKIRGYFSDIFEKSVKSDDGFIVPSHFHHGLIILLHTVSHLTADGIGLRHLCDWAAFVSHFSDAEFCAMFEAPLKKVGLWKCAKLLTACSVKYLGAPVKEFSKDIEEELVDAIIEDIFTGGNFGRKQEGREQQIKFISNRSDNTVDNKPVLSQLFITLNYKAKRRYKAVNKYSFLLPFGWAGVIFGYIKLSLLGKRKNSDIKTHIKTAQQRKNIYSQIELFKV